MGNEEEDDKTEVISFSQETETNAPAPTEEVSVTVNTDSQQTIVTNIDEEPTRVVTPDDEKTAADLSLSGLTKPTEEAEEEENTAIFGGAVLDLKDPNTNERCDPRKVRSVLGTFKVYVLRKGKTEEFVFEGLRKKENYTETEIKKGFEEYCEIRDNFKPSLLQRIKTLFSRLRRN